MGGSVIKLLKCLNFVEDIGTLSDYLNVILLKHDEKNKIVLVMLYVCMCVGIYMLNSDNTIKIIAIVLSYLTLYILS